MADMTRRFVAVTVCLTATVAFLVGLVVAGNMTPAPAVSAPSERPAPVRAASAVSIAPGTVSFADVAERLNPAVVNIDATSRGDGRRRRVTPQIPDSPDPFDRPQAPPDRDGPRRGAGTGFIIDADGFILTNHHVIEGADRIMVGLTDGRNLRAERVGSDPDTDIALIKVESPRPLPFAPLGNSDSLRVGEWVIAIGNPLAYEHTVTVGVVSFIGRKLFDASLDDYIQTDAAINFGNSGGPLINSAGEVIGINSAISSRASNIGFAVPINQAKAILEQLKTRGRVSRGFMGVGLTDVTPALQRSLHLSVEHGAMVQDVNAASPAERAGLRPYDVIVDVDGQRVITNEELIRDISARQPGTVVRLGVMRDGNRQNLTVKLGERPARSEDSESDSVGNRARPQQIDPPGEPALGIVVRELDRTFVGRLEIPQSVQGVVISRVDPTGPGFQAVLRRGFVIMEINRRPVRSVSDYERQVSAARAGDVLTLYVYDPTIAQRSLVTVTVE